MTCRIAAILLFCLSFLTAAPPGAQSLAEFDVLVERGLRELSTPGAAVGLIQDGKVVLAKGYGVCDLKSRKPVTARTLFALGSVTKSFTALAVASVIEEGKLDWDTPVREFLPWFRMYDPAATEGITLRDMLTHRSGLPRHDFIRFSTYLTREELVRRIRYLEPNRPFRDIYQYNNLMFVTAGYVAGVRAGSTWEGLVRDRIFQPLGMAGSNTSVLDSQKASDFARPYSVGPEGAVPEEFYEYAKFGVGPNGAVNSNVEDMLKYLQMWLDGGKANGREIVSEKQFRELRKPVTVVNDTASYAPGWRVEHYRGTLRIQHGGAITGFRAFATWIPSRNAAIIVMINSETPLADILGDDLTDRVLGLETRERITPVASRLRNRTNTNSNGRPAAKAKLNHPLDAYTGAFEHPAYGRVPIAQNGQSLEVRFPALTLTLQPAGYDTFWNSRGFVQFHFDEAGRVAEVLLPLESAVKPLVFSRVP